MLGLTAVEDMLAELVVLHRGAESWCVNILGESYKLRKAV